MEPDDNFDLINSYNIEESLPRQLPKAVICNKVTPIPLVPDVSLVFDSNHKDLRNYSYKDIGNSEPLHEEGIISNTRDENAPRRIKPMPIAPFPNETYAAWRARAHNNQSCTSSRLTEATFKSSALNPCDSDERSAAVRKVRETPTIPPFGKDLSHQNTIPALVKNNYVHSNGQTVSQEIRERPVDFTRISHKKESIPEMCRYQTNNNPSNNKTGMSDTYQGTTHNFSEYPKSTLISKEDKHNYGISSESQSLPDHLVLIAERHKNNKPQFECTMKRTEHLHQLGQVQPPKEIVDFGRSDGWSESSVTAKEEGTTKKRDALRDLYRIVQLQNEQLKSLQSQVEKLLKKNISEVPKLAEPARSKGSVVQYIEEGTQTSSNTTGNVSSVGVMTSFIDSNKACSSVADGDYAVDNDATCKWKGCHCRTVTSGTVAIDVGSNVGNVKEPDHLTKYTTATSNPVSRKYDAPRSLVRNMRNIHQIIVEESESDESTSKLNGGMALQTKGSNHQSSQVQQGSGGKGCGSNLNKPSSKCSNAGRPSTRMTGSSDRCKMERRGSNSDTPSYNGKRIQERNLQICRPLENEKCCPERNSANRKAIAVNNRQNDVEMTMTLNGVDLQTVTEPQLSPEPSIHVDIQDYQEFSGEMEGSSDEDSYYSENEDSNSKSGEEENPVDVDHRQVNTNPSGYKAENQEGNNGKVGWTFYNNVLGQVNKLLENQKPTDLPPAIRDESNQSGNLLPRKSATSVTVSPSATSGLPSSKPQFQCPDYNSQKALPIPNLEVVREATLQHLRQLGIDLSSDQDKNKFPTPMSTNNMPNPGVRDFHSTRRVTFDPNSNRGRFVGERRPTETSLRIKALALKYLSDEQLASCGYLDLKGSSQPEPQQVSEQPSCLPRGVIGEMSSSADFTLYGMNGTNLSFTTLRYLQRYQLLPSNETGPAGIWRHQDGIQQANFLEAASVRGADLGDSRSPGQIDYTNDYMEGFRQGANIAMGLNGHGGNAHSSTPANKIDHVLPSNKVTDAGKEVYFLQNRGDFPNGAGEVNCAGDQEGYLEKKGAAKQRSRGKQRGQQVARDRNGCKRNGHQNPCLPGNAGGERSPLCNVLRENDQKQRVHIGSLKSSNILDITALRQQPKLL